ncbi:hypothetical protein [Agrobacterium vaccinii]|uniref:hypothetical protein n=1 Tax=Agrobacterium vaccinii TaxID=2735528 RepID=UPI001E2ABAA9|nr:hypothetical protein [Agrobacterium vaccinii]UHS55871.1 hypothetical protein HRS00_03110 [Agrobacterium vaccinii]
MMTLEPRDILLEVEDLIRTMPEVQYGWSDPSAVDWIGRARAILTLPQLHIAVDASVAIQQAISGMSQSSWQGKQTVQILLSQVRHTIRMQTVGPLAIAVSKGMVFDYFDGLKKIIQEARGDILIVDPYMDAELVSRYLPFVERSVAIRLLASKNVATLRPAATLFAQQYQCNIEVRRAASLHDRFIFIDNKRGFQSGASFHQGGVKSPTTLTEITDTFNVVQKTYEDFWSAGEVAT